AVGHTKSHRAWVPQDLVKERSVQRLPCLAIAGDPEQASGFGAVVVPEGHQCLANPCDGTELSRPLQVWRDRLSPVQVAVLPPDDWPFRTTSERGPNHNDSVVDDS